MIQRHWPLSATPHLPKPSPLPPNGHDLQFSGNAFQNKTATIVVDPSCKNALIENNQGATTVSKQVEFNHGRDECPVQHAKPLERHRMSVL